MHFADAEPVAAPAPDPPPFRGGHTSTHAPAEPLDRSVRTPPQLAEMTERVSGGTGEALRQLAERLVDRLRLSFAGIFPSKTKWFTRSAFLAR